MNLNLPRSFVPESALSVAGLTNYIQLLLEQDNQLQQIWVTGEVASANRYRSGLFFTLQDPTAKAAISCVVWNSQLEKLAVLPTQGEQVILLGRINVHPQRGSYQLTIWQALPAGEGLRALRYRQLRDRLEAEGLFDSAHKRALPPHPQTVAVVTSPQAAAWGDIQRTLTGRYPGLRVLLSPALVQGEQAPQAIVAAIARVERDARADVLILSRGGGAVTDLACFNDEAVVRAVAMCPIPVIAGIGHQRDESLADLAADICAHTPTAAAELAVPCLADLVAAHTERGDHLRYAVQHYLDGSHQRVQGLRQRAQRLQLDRQLQQEIHRVKLLRHRLRQATQQQLQQATQHCQMLQEKLATLDPAAVLQRGYAVVRLMNGTVARSSTHLTVGQALRIQLSQGEIAVAITEVLNATPDGDETYYKGNK